MANQQTVQIDLSKTKGLACMACSNEHFEKVYFLRVLNKFQSPTGREEMIPVESFRCDHCKKVYEFTSDRKII